MAKVFILMIMLVGCSKRENAAPIPPPAKEGINILYIGNSLTQTNNLPEIVSQLGNLDSVSISYKDMSIGGVSLEDHWNDGKIQKEIATGNYDYVVVQQGPSSLSASRALLIEYVKKIKDICVASKSNLCVYMIWPDKNRLSFFDDVIYSYTQAALQTQSLLAPAGLAWKNAWQLNNQLPLYSFDDFHPSTMGSVLAALTVYGAIKQKADFNYLSYKKLPWKIDISDRQLILLKQAALKALGK